MKSTDQVIKKRAAREAARRVRKRTAGEVGAGLGICGQRVDIVAGERLRGKVNWGQLTQSNAEDSPKGSQLEAWLETKRHSYPIGGTGLTAGLWIHT